MPSSFYPVLSDGKSNLVVNVQRFHRGSPTGSAPDYAHTVFTPVEMALPSLPPGIEEPNCAVRCGVLTTRSRTFCVIVKSTGKLKVHFAALAASSYLDDGLDFHHPVHVTLRPETIP